MIPQKQISIFFLLLVSFYVLTCLCLGQDYSKTPVFFVHGHGMSAGSWDILISFLKKSGYPSQFCRAIQLIPSDGANIPVAENQIAPFIEKFLSDINEFISANYPQIPLKTKIDLVSHSMGGLSSRWYAARVRPDRVRKWISLAGANHGTNALLPYIKNIGDGADDCCPAFAKNEQESYVQYQLNGDPYKADIDETPYGIGTDSPGVAVIPPDETKRIFYVTLRTIIDEWIKPDESVIVDGAGGINIAIPQDIRARETPGGNIRLDNGVGHDQMLADQDTMRLVKIFLELKESAQVKKKMRARR